MHDKQGNEIDPRKLQTAQYAALPPGLMFSTSDTVAMARLGLSDSVTAPCGGTIPTCAVADGKTVCGCGHVHPPQFHSVNLPAIFGALANLRERVKALETCSKPCAGEDCEPSDHLCGNGRPCEHHDRLAIAEQALRAPSITASDVETWRKNTMRPDEVLGFAGEIPITGRFLLNALAELTDNA